MRWAVAIMVAAGCGGGGGAPADGPAADAPPVRHAHVVTTPASVDLGTQIVDYDSAASTIVATNTGGEPTAPLAVSIAPTGAFRVTHSTCTGVLAAGASCTVDVVGKPAVAGAASALLAIADAQVPLTLVGVTDGALTLSPTSWAFATTSPGAIGETHRFTVTNDGSHPRGPLLVTKAGTNPDDFALAADTCTGATLAPTEVCHLDVTFAPTVTGTRSAAFDITGGGTTSASVSGEAVDDANGFITTSSGTIDLGVVKVGDTATRTFTVTNAGASSSGAITVTRTGDAELSATSHCTSLAGGASCTVDVTFAPTSNGDAQAQIHVAAALSTSVDVAVFATAYVPGPMTIAPSQANFGAVVTGTTGAARRFAVTNLSGVATGALAVAKSGDGAAFSIAADTCSSATLAAGASCHVDVTFAPGAVLGRRDAALAVSGTPGGLATAQLTGYGITASTLGVTPATLDLGTHSSGTITTLPVTVTNNGTSATGAIAVARTGDPQLSATSHCTTLAPGASCTVDVTFQPTVPGGDVEAVLAISAPGGAAQAVARGTSLGPPGLSFAPGLIDLGATEAATTGATQRVDVVNNGAATTGALSVATSGADAGDFAVVGDTCSGAMLASAQACHLDLRFAPGAAPGPRHATITVSGTPGSTGGAPVIGYAVPPP